LGHTPQACFLIKNRLPKKSAWRPFTEQNVGKMQDLFSHATPHFSTKSCSQKLTMYHVLAIVVRTN
jgi:hypothetical protein